MAPPALLVTVEEVLEYFESKARPLKEDITVPSVFSKNKLLDNLGKEGVGGEGEHLTVVQRAENFLNRDVWQIYGARRVLHFASWKPRRVHNSAIIYQTAPAAPLSQFLTAFPGV